MLRKRTQLLAKIESVEGTAVALAAADADLALSLGADRIRNMVERNAVQTSLDRFSDNIGRGSLGFSYGLDLRGSGALATRPRFGKHLRACAMREASITSLAVGAITGGPYKHGEYVTGGTSNARGIVIEDTAASPIKVGVVSGTFAGGEVITGATSGATSTTSGTTASQGWLYIGDSYVASSIATTGSWTGTPELNEPFEGGVSGASGYLRGGVLAGAPGTLYFEMVKGTGSFAALETLTGQTSGATVSTAAATAETTAWTPSLTMQENCDGFFKRARGVRGNSVIVLAAGEPGRIDFAMRGAIAAHGDAAILTGASYETTAIQRFASATATLDGFSFPIGALGIDLGNAVGMRADATAADGDLSAFIGDKNPTVTLDPEMVPASAYDYLTKLDAATTASIKVVMGTAGGNRISILVPALQFEAHAYGDREGIATAGISARPRKYLDNDVGAAIALWMD